MLDEERQPLLRKDGDVEHDGLPWSQVIILGIWRGTHVRYKQS